MHPRFRTRFRHLLLASAMLGACDGAAPPPPADAPPVPSAGAADAPAASGIPREEGAETRGTAPAAADAAPRTFVFLRDAAGDAVDTLGYEQLARESRSLTGELRPTTGPRTTYRVDLTADERVQSVELRGWAAGASAADPPVEVARGTFVGDSLIGSARQGERVTETRVRTEAGAIPYLSPSVGLMEQVVRRARVLGGDTVELPMFLLRAEGNTVLARVVWASADSVILRVGGSEGHLVLDDALRIVRGTNPTAGTRFLRVR